MANEINLTASLSAYKAAIMSSTIGRAVNGLAFTMSGNFAVQNTISVAITATLIPLGQVVQPHWAFFNNLDTTNYVTLCNGVSGAVFARLYPGEPAFLPLDPTAVPYATANTAACLLEYLILSL